MIVNSRISLACSSNQATGGCACETSTIGLAKRRLHIGDAKTDAGVRMVYLHPASVDHLTSYGAGGTAAPMDTPAFPTQTCAIAAGLDIPYVRPRRLG